MSLAERNHDLMHVSDFEILREARLRGLVQSVYATEPYYQEQHARYKHEPGFQDAIKTAVFRHLADELQKDPGSFVTFETPHKDNDWTYRAVIHLAKGSQS